MRGMSAPTPEVLALLEATFDAAVLESRAIRDARDEQHPLHLWIERASVDAKGSTRDQALHERLGRSQQPWSERGLGSPEHAEQAATSSHAARRWGVLGRQRVPAYDVDRRVPEPHERLVGVAASAQRARDPRSGSDRLASPRTPGALGNLE